MLVGASITSFHYADDALLWGIQPAGLPYVAFGTGLFDFDHDGLLDLFITNGHIHPQKGDRWRMIPQPDQLYVQTRPGRFLEVSERAGPYFRVRGVGRAAVFFDYDLDGDVDILSPTTSDGPILRRTGRRRRGAGFSFDSSRPKA